jgi:hypothetical protein
LQTELELLQAHLQSALAEVANVTQKHDAQAAQTEAALLEVCKSLGMQQQQLEQQEMCTGMIHQLLQECLPGLGGGQSFSIPEQVKNNLGTPLSRQMEQLVTRQETVETSVDTLQKDVKALQDRLACYGSGGNFAPATLVKPRGGDFSHAGGQLPKLLNDDRQGTMANLEAANNALGDLLAEIAPTTASVGSSPDSRHSKASHFDDVSSRVLVALQVEVERLCEDARAGLQQKLCEDVRLFEVRQAEIQSSMEGKQAFIDDIAGTLRKEQQASQDIRKDLQALREEFDNAFQERLQKSLEVLASAQDRQSEEWSRRLDHLREDFKESGSANMHIKHKELCYLVHVQQNMLSQHAEELETLRHEQHAGLTSMTSAMKQKLDAVSELSHFLQQKVDVVCAQQGPTWSHIADSLATRQRQPDPLDMMRVLQQELSSVSGAAGSLQKELDTASKRVSNATPASCWPSLHKKLSDLTEDINDIGDSQRPNVEADAECVAANTVRQQLFGNSSMQAELSQLSGLTQDLRDHFGHGPSVDWREACSGQAMPEGSTATWKGLKEELNCAAEVLHNASTGSSILPAPAATSAPASSSHFEAAELQQKLKSVLQNLQEADRSTAAEPHGPACREVAAPPDADGDWWRELQDKHPDLAHLVQTQRTELVRIVGSQAFAMPTSPASPSARHA